MDIHKLRGPDGAASGVTADDALGIVVGGRKTISPKKLVSQAEYLDSCPMPTDWSSERAVEDFAGAMPEGGYNGHARVMGKLFLDFMREHPECERMPADSERDWPRLSDGTTDWDAKPTIRVEGVGEYIERIDPERKQKLDYCGATGFTWGWAVNAARTAMGWGPVANPAIVTINLPDIPGVDQ